MLPFYFIRFKVFSLFFASLEYGRFVVSIKGYLDANLTDELDENDPPLSLGTDVFIQMEVIANDTDVTLHVLRCWLTEVENRNNDPQFNLIVSG